MPGKFVIDQHPEGAQKGKWRWTLYADNKNKIATSGEGYVSKRECARMVHRLKEIYSSAPVEDENGANISRAAVVLEGRNPLFPDG